MNEKLLLEQIDKFVDENKENVLRDLKSLVDINSVEGEPAPGAPFGPGPRKALDKALEIAKGFGLVTDDCSGYMGYAEIPGKSEKQIATIAHLDVVPEGNGWHDCAPYDMTIRDGWILGRGVADDKGPAVLTLYLAKFFKERGEELPYTLRILLGVNEETHMGDVDYYLEHYPMPAFCFTPDAEFPVCYGEKGGLNGELVSGKISGNLVEFSGGVAHNVVPDRAFALVKADLGRLAETDRIKLSAESEGVVRISAFGKGGHAAMPAGTVNAIALIIDYLLDNKLCTESENAALEMLRTLHASTDGSSVGIDSKDELFDPLTCVGGVISLEDGRLHQSIDIRFPTSTDAETLTAKLTAHAETAGGTFVCEGSRVPFYVDPNLPVIQALIDTYNDVTGRHEKPFTMGGGTYARHFASAVSFGMEEPDEVKPEWVGNMHGPNEGASEEVLFRSLKIYILAVHRLMQLDF